MVTPAEMTRISLTGPKKQLEKVIDRLYELELLDIDDFDGEIETGEPFEEAEELSEVLVDVRSLLSKLPETEAGKSEELFLDTIEKDIEVVRERVENVEEEINELEARKAKIKEQKEFFEKLEGTGLEKKDLEGTDKLDVFIGELDRENFEEETGSDSYEIVEGQEASVVFYYAERAGEIEPALREASGSRFNMVETDLEGDIDQIIGKLRKQDQELDEEIVGMRKELDRLAEKWRPKLESAEDYLAGKVEKKEAPIRFGVMERSFVAEGWVPTAELEELKQELEEETRGSIHIEEEEGGEPPVKHENNRVVEPFESLTDLVSVPKYGEIDPSFVIMLTFPAMFGFMIGDAGYGFTSLAVFYAGYKKVPQVQAIFKSLMYASVATIIFGLAFGDMFGYIIFGHHSVLAEVTGLHIFEQIPVLFHRAEHLGQVFDIAALIGLVHINIGYLIGIINEYRQHSLKEAFLEKGSWVMLEIGALLWYFMGVQVGAPVMILSVIALAVGEGVEGVVEIPSLLSNVLSYLRIFGVAVAAVSLAKVVNAMAAPLFNMGGAIGISMGILLLMIGHTFNTFIKIMEGFLQGIRLHYVELFDKFYEGGGRKYNPFGTRDL